MPCYFSFKRCIYLYHHAACNQNGLKWRHLPIHARGEARRLLAETCLYLFMLCDSTFNILHFTRTKVQSIWQKHRVRCSYKLEFVFFSQTHQ